MRTSDPDEGAGAEADADGAVVSLLAAGVVTAVGAGEG